MCHKTQKKSDILQNPNRIFLSSFSFLGRNTPDENEETVLQKIKKPLFFKISLFYLRIHGYMLYKRGWVLKI